MDDEYGKRLHFSLLIDNPFTGCYHQDNRASSRMSNGVAFEHEKRVIAAFFPTAIIAVMWEIGGKLMVTPSAKILLKTFFIFAKTIK